MIRAGIRRIFCAVVPDKIICIVPLVSYIVLVGMISFAVIYTHSGYIEAVRICFSVIQFCQLGVKSVYHSARAVFHNVVLRSALSRNFRTIYSPGFSNYGVAEKRFTAAIELGLPSHKVISPYVRSGRHIGPYGIPGIYINGIVKSVINTVPNIRIKVNRDTGRYSFSAFGKAYLNMSCTVETAAIANREIFFIKYGGNSLGQLTIICISE